MGPHTRTVRGGQGSVLERDDGQTAAATAREAVNGTTTLLADLPYGPEAAEVAREAVTVALHGAARELLDDARLITSELATNAFASGRAPLVLCVDRTRPAAGGLEVEITVTDGGCLRPRSVTPAVPGEDDESGRGLLIVAALADAWSLRTGVARTRAWCRLTSGGGS
ncbi:ATP-binding protein [Streptomyces sp. NPDC058426]|uniref:ATP-binding protein n=1 Tax=Streptomyces sp. NPDC058426 TaxID=3346493 RepID=UPI00364F0677